jgi:peroxiredoxin Q/BCP
LRRDYAKFRARDTEILSIAPEDLEEVRDYWERERLPFVGLADPEHEVADRYGQRVRLLRLGRLPSQLIIDKAGTIRSRHDASSMSDIPRNRGVLTELQEIQRERD